MKRKKLADRRHRTFEMWFFEVASAAERQLPAEEQEHAFEMWLAQETAWSQTTEDFEEFDEYGNPPDSSKMH